MIFSLAMEGYGQNEKKEKLKELIDDCVLLCKTKAWHVVTTKSIFKTGHLNPTPTAASMTATE